MVKPNIVLLGSSDVDARLALAINLTSSFNVHVVGSNPELLNLFRNNGISYHVFSFSHSVNIISDFYTLLSLYKIFKSIKPVLVHTFDSKLSILGRFAAYFSSVPIITSTITGLGYLFSVDKLKFRFYRFLFLILSFILSRLSTNTVFQNFDDFNHFTRLKIVPVKKASCILGSGVDTNLFSPSPFFSHLSNDANTKPFVVLMISRVSKIKGALVFAKCASLIKKTHPDIIFKLAGSLPDSSSDLSHSELTFIKDNVDFLGSVSNVSDLYKNSHVFVLPTMYKEGLPRVLLEAAASGLPLISTVAPGVREILIDNFNGFVVSPSDEFELTDSILSLYENSFQRYYFGRNSRDLALSRFDIKFISSQYEQLFLRLINEV